MLTCNNDCIYQCDGNCIVDDKQNQIALCPKLKNKVNGLTHGADINKLNTVGDIGTH